MQFPGRRVEMPIALDDRWNKEALHRYMASTRDKAVYLPSNVEYLANNNGLADSGEALRKLVLSDWVRSSFRHRSRRLIRTEAGVGCWFLLGLPVSHPRKFAPSRYTMVYGSNYFARLTRAAV